MSAGAQGLGLLAAGWLGNTLEDLLALTVAGMASYVAVLNLPLKRSDIKAKVAKVANNFMEGVTDAMQQVRSSLILLFHHALSCSIFDRLAVAVEELFHRPVRLSFYLLPFSAYHVEMLLCLLLLAAHLSPSMAGWPLLGGWVPAAAVLAL